MKEGESSTSKLQMGWNLHRFSKKALLYLIPPLIVAAVLLLVYYLKGIYPFGSLTVIYGDMDQHYIPFSYHIYDVFHNGKSLFWDPYLGTGSNIFGIEALSGMFSPISWLVVFTSRTNIPYFASFLLLLRMALLSLTSFVFMNRLFRNTPVFWRVTLSVMYAFSGYALIFYTNMVWMDCAILFPLILLALKDLFDRDRIIGYVCVLSVNLIVSYYISFMVLLFVFFSSGVFLWFYIEKNRRKKVLVNLGIGTISALLLTSFVTIPAFLQSASSIRFGGFSYLNVIGTDASNSVTLNKTVFFFFAAISLVVFIKILAGYRNNKRMVAVFGLLMALTVSQVLVEAVNLLWYGGSYVCYPLRFGFIPIFLLLAGCAYYFSDYFVKKTNKNGNYAIGTDENARHAIAAGPDSKCEPEAAADFHMEVRRVDPEPLAKRPGKRIIPVLYALIALAAYLFAVYQGSTFGEAINRTLYGYWGITEDLSLLFISTAALFGISIWVILMLRNGRIKYALLAVVILTEIFTHSMWYIGVPPRIEGHIDTWTSVANKLNSDLTIDNSTISRYKDAESVMNANYPLVLGAQSASSYLHIIEARQQKAFSLLGYSSNYTRILDTGGTLFSDMVLNVNYVLSSKAYSKDIFDLAGESSVFYIYKNKYTLPAGLVFTRSTAGSGSADSLDFADGTNPLDNQNSMYRTLFGKTDDLIEMVAATPKLTNMKIEQKGNLLRCTLDASNQTGIMEYQFSVTGMQEVYLSAANISDTVYVIVNGQSIKAPTFGNLGNTSFPASYNNGILDLGLYEDETVQVQILAGGNVDFTSLSIGTLSIEKIKALSNQSLSSAKDSNPSNDSSPSITGNKISVDINSNQEGQSLFLPVNYDRGWKCTINGKSVAVGKAFGTFILLDLAEGQNVIELRFVPPGFDTGLIVSGATLLLWIAVLLFKKRKGMRNRLEVFTEGAANAVYITFWAVYSAAVIFIYIIPILSFIIRNLIKLFPK